MSYSDIHNKINIPRSTLSFWLKEIKLTDRQENDLRRRQFEALKNGLESRKNKILKFIKEIDDSSAKAIKAISKKEFWLMGLALYWREGLLAGGENNIKRGVNFATSDRYLAKFFLRWLQEAGDIKKEEILLDIFINSRDNNKKKSAIKYWSSVTGYYESDFPRVYVYPDKKKIKSRNIGHKAENGLVRIRVKSSSVLERQIRGWIRSIINMYWR